MLEEAPPDKRPVLERKISDKFGPVALAVAKDALEPKYDRRGGERPWQPRKQEYLTQLAIAEPRALDICVADEIHCLRLHRHRAPPAGRGVPANGVAGRLGADHLVVPLDAGDPGDRGSDWPQREMLAELRLMSADLVRSLRRKRGGPVSRIAASALAAGARLRAWAARRRRFRSIRSAFCSINDVYVADTLADGRGGLARVATVRNRLADQGPVLFVLAGDVLSPSLLSKYYGGRQMVDALNAAKLDYATFGNHEFDLAASTRCSRGSTASKFKWISSNCTLPTARRCPKVLPWDTVRVSGHKVGLFGLTLQGSYPAHVRCTNPDTAAQRASTRSPQRVPISSSASPIRPSRPTGICSLGSRGSI